MPSFFSSSLGILLQLPVRASTPIPGTPSAIGASFGDQPAHRSRTCFRRNLRASTSKFTSVPLVLRMIRAVTPLPFVSSADSTSCRADDCAWLVVMGGATASTIMNRISPKTVTVSPTFQHGDASRGIMGAMSTATMACVTPRIRC